jgi:hypothetical protein
MKGVFSILSLVITMAIGMYIYSLQAKNVMPVNAGGTGEDAATITGVKNDLISFANAERGYLASQGKYASLDELVAGNYITVKRERPPYVYDIQTMENGFRATATRTTKGSPAQLWITDSMEVQSSN